ncbi:MAG: SAM-dependent methyltransferase [Bacteroidales bacterium]
MQGKIYLIPIPIGDDQLESTIPSKVPEVVRNLNHFIVENIRTARRYIRQLSREKNIDNIKFYILNKYTSEQEYANFFQPVNQGYDIGIISEAGVPGVADPGGEIVRLAHKKNIEIIPLVGPSSIILALMASGLNGQNFAFRGYLPIKKNERVKAIKQLEKISRTEGKTQIFMETPYRNMQLLSSLLDSCSSNSLLCIATNITSPNEFIKTQEIGKWKKNPPDLNKLPTIFLLYAG